MVQESSVGESLTLKVVVSGCDCGPAAGQLSIIVDSNAVRLCSLDTDKCFMLRLSTRFQSYMLNEVKIASRNRISKQFGNFEQKII